MTTATKDASSPATIDMPPPPTKTWTQRNGEAIAVVGAAILFTICMGIVHLLRIPFNPWFK